MLVDSENKIGYLLHIYKHSEKDNIKQSDSNKLKRLADQYAKDLMRYEK